MSGIFVGETNILLGYFASCSVETLERNLMKEKQRTGGKKRERTSKGAKKRKFLLALLCLPSLSQVEKQVDRKDCASVNARNPRASGYHAIMRV